MFEGFDDEERDRAITGKLDLLEQLQISKRDHDQLQKLPEDAKKDEGECVGYDAPRRQAGGSAAPASRSSLRPPPRPQKQVPVSGGVKIATRVAVAAAATVAV
eukprot:TRINITY_DN27471_c0_g1_i2.p1 TRINITY_DN27471_c0_g1~~TRINITY_DN27471_c0_g1_i2.p1  ORF type:complete len:103 (-),score=14.36 TRINITY_DN27471_c0_g1_i2:193-501(-)